MTPHIYILYDWCIHPLLLLVYYPYFYAHLVASPFSSVDNVMWTPNERLTGRDLVLGMCVCMRLSVCMHGFECVYAYL